MPEMKWDGGERHRFKFLEAYLICLKGPKSISLEISSISSYVSNNSTSK